ncbi:MAG: hypothetical protein EOP53_23335 [Sphingobacteriales bacterium]|nr:MAG: hypothetical protein EOP53_23335 [Sphingobacteriales bacterium]
MQYESFFNSEDECLLYEMHFDKKYRNNFNKEDFYIRRDTIENALSEIKDQFALKEISPLKLDRFHLYNQYKDIHNLRSFQLIKAQCPAFLNLVNYNYEWKNGKYSGLDFGLYIYGGISLPKDYKNIGLRPELIGDKIKEWFKKDEVKFDDSQDFNNKFYVLCEDAELAKSFFTPEIIQFLELYDDLHLEVINNRLLFRPSKKHVTPIEILETIQALLFISEALH